MHSLSPRRHRSRLGAIMLDTLIGTDPAADLSELRALVAVVESPADRLLARYRGRPSQPFHAARW
jgi:hypothetical protein